MCRRNAEDNRRREIDKDGGRERKRAREKERESNRISMIVFLNYLFSGISHAENRTNKLLCVSQLEWDLLLFSANTHNLIIVDFNL